MADPFRSRLSLKGRGGSSFRGEARRAPGKATSWSSRVATLGLLWWLGVAVSALSAPALAAPVFTPVSGSPFATGSNPSSAAFSPTGTFLGVANAKDGTISVFSVGAGNTLTPVAGSPFTTGSNPSSVAFTPNGGLLAVANAGDDTASIFSVGLDGSLTPATNSPSATGSHPSSVAFNTYGAFLAVANAGDDTVSIFSVAAGGALAPVPGSPFVTGSDPSSVAFSPNGSLLATANEGDGNISVFSVAANGALTPVTGSPFVTGSHPSSLTFGAWEPGPVTANAGDSTVSMFSAANDGTLTQMWGSPFAVGSGPSSVALSLPFNSLLATADSDANTISVFAVQLNGSSASLTPVAGSPFGTGSHPQSVVFSATGLLASANSSGNTVSVFEPGPPTANIEWPRAFGMYTVGQIVPTTFWCDSAPYAPPVASCADSNGVNAGVYTGSGQLDTTTVGWHTYTVTAVSRDGQSGSTSITYSVPADPSVQISAPASGGVYGVGEWVATAFACREGAGGPGLSACVDNNSTSTFNGGGGRLDTTALGVHTYTVTARSQDGRTATSSITYTIVVMPPSNYGVPGTTRNAIVGGHLVAFPGAWSGSPPITYSYQWQRCRPTCATVAGATGSTYTLTAADTGAMLRVLITATNSAGSAQAVSEQVGPVAPSGAQIKAFLISQLLPPGKAVTITLLLRSGYSRSFRPPGAGRVSVGWYYLPRGANLSTPNRRPTPLLIAAGTAKFLDTTPVKLVIRLSPGSRRMLKHITAIKLTARGIYTRDGFPAVEATKSFTLKR